MKRPKWMSRIPKITIIFLLAIGLIVGLIAITGLTIAVSIASVNYDINGDGKVSTEDVTVLETFIGMYDLNQDGQIDQADVQFLKDYIEENQSIWVSPTGHSDWNNKACAYDNNVITYAETCHGDTYLELTIPETFCDKVRINAQRSGPISADPDITLEVFYTGNYHTIYSGVVAKDTWVETPIGSSQHITKVRVKSNETLHCGALPFTLRVKEIELHSLSSN